MKSGQQAAFILLIAVGTLYWLYIRGRLAPAIRVLSGDPATATAVPNTSGGKQPYPVGPGGLPAPPGYGSIYGNNIVAGDDITKILAQAGFPMPVYTPPISGGTVPTQSTARQLKDTALNTGLTLLAATGPVGAAVGGILKGIGIKL